LNGQDALSGRVIPVQPIPYDLLQVTHPLNAQSRSPGDPCHCLAKDNASSAAIVETYPIQDCREITKMQNGLGIGNAGDPSYTIDTTGAQGVGHKMRMRSLTPLECERLMGFRDGYTDIPKKTKRKVDGNRYKALGNSIAVNTLRWIGRRIELVDAVPMEET
jgi:DNA (cytosine-5)-methyltransferase 1